MKIVKYILFLILILIIGGAVYFGTQDGSFDVASERTIPAPPSLVFEKVNDLEQWQNWGPWSAADPDMQLQFSETSKGQGASYSWESSKVGNGTITTTLVAENDSINQEIVFNTPMGDSSNDVYWKFKPTEDGATAVRWGMKGEHTFIEKVLLAFQNPPFDVSLKQMFDDGLANMEAQLEQEMNAYTITFEGVKEYGGGYYLYTTTASKIDEMGTRMGPMFGKIQAFAQQNSISLSGMPFTIYSDWDELNGTAIYSTAIPVNERIIINEGDVLCGYMEPLTAVKTVLKGKYDHLAEAYARTEAYILENNLARDPSHNFFEIYANDPGNFPNPADWKTEIYIPVYPKPATDPSL